MTAEDVYLGDGLYVGFDGYQVKLYSHNGVHPTNSVYLEPEVLRAFVKWLQENGMVTLL